MSQPVSTCPLGCRGGRLRSWGDRGALAFLVLGLSVAPRCTVADECQGEYDRLLPLITLNQFVYFNDLNTATLAGSNASTSSYFNSFKLLTFPKQTSKAFTCNKSHTSVLCQLAAFNVDHEPFNNEIPVETMLARAGNTPSLWQCQKGGLPTAAYPHGGWVLSTVQNVSSPYIRQAKLLSQAERFIDAISTSNGDGGLVNRAVSTERPTESWGPPQGPCDANHA